MTQDLIKHKKTLPISDSFLDRCVDGVCCLGITWALSLFLFPVIGVTFHGGSSLLAAFCASVLVALLSLRRWLAPAVAAVFVALAGCGVLLGWVFAERTPLQILLWIMDLISSLPTILARRFSLSEAMASFPFQFFLALLLACVAWFFLRCCFSFLVLAAEITAQSVFLWAGQYEQRDLALLVGLGTLILCLPRLFFSTLNPKQEPKKGQPKPEFLREGKKERKKRETAYLIPRYTLQAMAIPVALVCTLGAWAIIPEDTSGWRSTFLNHMVSDVNDYLQWKGGEGSNQPSFDLSVSGYMPLSTRLGGPVDPNQDTVLHVDSDKPMFLRGSVWDTYTGENWEDSRINGRFRWESLLWRGLRRQYFAPSLPLGGGQAENLAREMTTTVHLSITHWNSRLYSLFAPQNLYSIEYPVNWKRDTYFNIQSELFLEGMVPYAATYDMDGSYYDRSLPDFDQNMLALEQLAGKERDRHWEEITQAYLQLPQELPQSVYQLAESITKGLDSPYQKACAIEQWLAQNCHYTLTPQVPEEGVDFVAQFLESRDGYCTYYASAMAVLARCAGLPSRYVNGYGLTPASGQGADYLATNATAHAWCEIYFSGIGWISFDPISWQEAEEIRALNAPQEEPEQEAPQTTYVPQIPETTEELLDLDTIEREEGSQSQIKLGALWIIPFALLCLGVFLGTVFLFPYLCDRNFRLYERKYVSVKYPNRGEAAEYYYRDILRQLAIFDRSPLPGDTIYTFSKRADERVGAQPISMESIGEIITALRFGGITPTPQQLHLIERYHNRLEDRIREDLTSKQYFLRRVLPSFWRE